MLKKFVEDCLSWEKLPSGRGEECGESSTVEERAAETEFDELTAIHIPHCPPLPLTAIPIPHCPPLPLRWEEAENLAVKLSPGRREG